jgi:hypothetical protein
MDCVRQYGLLLYIATMDTENKEDIVQVLFCILFFPLILVMLISDWMEK